MEAKVLSNPFPGLRPFEADEEHLFFGREQEIDELLRRLRTTRFLLVAGSSGTGKSSLVRSGLIPALQSGSMLQAGSNWRIILFRPGDNPIANLAAAMDAPDALGSEGELASTNRVLLEATLLRSSLGIVQAVRLAQTPSNDNVLIVVDQFEELFRFRRSGRGGNSRDEAAAFFKLLLEATGQQDLPIYIALTMRSSIWTPQLRRGRALIARVMNSSCRGFHRCKCSLGRLMRKKDHLVVVLARAALSDSLLVGGA